MDVGANISVSPQAALRCTCPPVRAGYVEKIWDHAAGSILVEEAGGTVTDAWGQPLEFSHGRLLQANQGVLASNGVNHHALSTTVAQILSSDPVSN